MLILFATLGMMMMVSANDLIALYLGLELQSLALYVVAAFDRDSVRSTEAGLKYFVLGALASGMLLYGASLIYGFAGTTSFAGLATAVRRRRPGRRVGLIIGLVFVIVGLAFKVSAVPFHMWTPDVYEGAPTPVTAFFSAAPKIAAIALFVRVHDRAVRRAASANGTRSSSFISIASMVLGAFAAIDQTNIKRLMAYSSIGHVGYALIGLAAGTPERHPRRAGLHGDLSVHDPRHLRLSSCACARRARWSRASPISPGSAAPSRALAAGARRSSCSRWPASRRSPASSASSTSSSPRSTPASDRLAVIGVVTSVVGAFYYLRIVKVMYFDEPAASFDRPIAAELNGVARRGRRRCTMLFFLLPGPLVGGAEAAAASLFAR